MRPKNNFYITKSLIILFLFLIRFAPLFSQDLFRAEIYLQGTNKGELLFNYTNEIQTLGTLQTLTHNYKNLNGGLFAREQVVLNQEELVTHTTEFYELEEFSRLEKKGNQVDVSFTRKNQSKQKTIPYESGIVFGPTQQEFIRKNLSLFGRGETVPFLVPAPEFTSLVGFTMQKVEKNEYNRAGVMVLKMETKSIFLRLIVGKNYFVVDENTGTVLEIHGPSILQRKVNGKWKFVDVDIYFDY